MTIDYTPISEIPKIAAASRASFLTHKTQSLEFRKEQVLALQRLVLENEKELLDAIYADLRRSPDFEIPTLTKACQNVLDNLETYTQSVKAPGLIEKDDCFVQMNPLGSVLIMGAWNFPIVLLLEPLLGAIAAGNTCVVKPSDVAQNSAKVLTRLIQKYMDPEVVFIVNGGPEEATVLLKERFDHIFFTGGTEIGRIVMTAAAKNLTPVTLELGGKCPVVITRNTDIAKAAQRIAFWKTMNCGQVCLSVNYVICPKDMQEALIQNIIGTWQHLHGKDARTNATYPRIVNQRQYARLSKVLEAAKTQNTVVYGGNTDADDLYIEPTIVTNVTLSDEIMKDEIFGPILPIITCDDLDEAIEMINQQEHPLNLNLFSDSKEEVDNVLRKTRSGAVTVNDISSHFGHDELPFGGVGHSGIGNYHGKYSIETFSHKRAVMIRSQAHL